MVKGGKVGLNFYGVVGCKVGIVEGFKFLDVLIKLGEVGEIWIFEDLVGYVIDFNSYVEEKVGDKFFKIKMIFKLVKN